MPPPTAPFGRVLTAMVTPFTAGGELDAVRAQELAVRLVDEGNDGLVVSGTTGESPTTSDAEKDLLLRAVVEAVGDRASVVAGVGTNDTRHSVELARAAEQAGASGLLAVTPYYSKPPQDGLRAHFTTVADATGLPVLLYDIPGRSGTPIETDTLLRLAEHPRIVANKDAKGDVLATQRVLAACDLAFYSGDDALNLPLLAVGAVGMVSVTAHLIAQRHVEMVSAFQAGDVTRARELNARGVAVTVGVMSRMQGAAAAKAALAMVGFPVGGVRLPLLDATERQREVLRQDLLEGEVALA
jgi:4-hydroxy-tetrahydrodipicolinate synthase